MGLCLPWSVPAGFAEGLCSGSEPMESLSYYKHGIMAGLARHGPTGCCSDGSVTVEIIIYVCQVLTKGSAVGVAAAFPEDLGASFAPVAYLGTCWCSLLQHRGA